MMRAPWFYRGLLRVFPRDMRREFGRDMERQFVRLLATTRGTARARLWMAAAIDAVIHGLGARWDGRHRPPVHRRQRSTSRWRMDNLCQDLRFAARLIRRQPGTAAIIVFTLGLALGANSAVFSASYAALLRPLPFSTPDRLVMIWEKRPAEGVMDNVVAPADFLDWARLSQSFVAMSLYDPTAVDLTGVGDPDRVLTAGVSASFFEVFGVRAAFGRTFLPAEDTPGSPRVVILSHRFWHERFGGDEGIVGRQIQLNGVPSEVVGVLPADVVFPGETIAEIFTPYVSQAGAEPPSRASHSLTVFARLKPEVSLEQARAEMDALGRYLELEYPQTNRGHGAHVVPMHAHLSQPLRGTLILLSVAVAAVLLIACINVTNLLLARAAGRRREMAVRAAVGAERGRLLRQTLTESALLTFFGATAGLVVAQWGAQLLAVSMPPILSAAHGVWSAPALLFTALLTLVTTIVSGVVPAWQLSNDDVNELKEGGRSPGVLRRRLRFGLIVAEVAMTSLLLVAAGLTLRSFERVLSQPAGFETDSRLTVRVALPRSRYPERDAYPRFVADLESRLRHLDGVAAAGATSMLPLSGNDARRGIAILGRQRPDAEAPWRAHQRIVTPGYFAALGLHMAHGRGLLPSDTLTARPVVVINETMARRYWPGQSPLGQQVRWSDQTIWREVVGVVTDVRYWGLERDVNPEIYSPSGQEVMGGVTFVLHTPGRDPGLFAAQVRRQVHAIDPLLPLFRVLTMEQVAAESVASRRWLVLLLTSVGIIALLLAAAGIYGVMAHIVSLRTGEIGIRLTLGARPRGVMRQVMGEALTQTALGLAIGLGIALAAMRGLQSQLYGIAPTDPFTLATVAFIFFVVAIAAVAVPARRAMTVDPVDALRAQ
jgi:putative ABC transport system permease protein